MSIISTINMPCMQLSLETLTLMGLNAFTWFNMTFNPLMFDLSFCWQGPMSIFNVGVLWYRCPKSHQSSDRCVWEPAYVAPFHLSGIGARCLRSFTGVDDRRLAMTQAHQSRVVTCFSEETK